jgi:hypothetical protein
VLGLDLRRLLADRAYSVAEKGSKVQLRMTVDGCYEGTVGKKGTIYTLKEVDCMGVVYLIDTDGRLFCTPYIDGLFSKYVD